MEKIATDTFSFEDIRTGGFVYVDKTAFLKPLADGSLGKQALAQIKAKGYHEKYLRRGKKVTLVGVAFDAGMRNLSDRVIEVVDSGRV